MTFLRLVLFAVGVPLTAWGALFLFNSDPNSGLEDTTIGAILLPFGLLALVAAFRRPNSDRPLFHWVAAGVVLGFVTLAFVYVASIADSIG